jgi:Tfp pilus assembly protein PilW
MTETLHFPKLRDESGFTLAELLVAMTASVLILFGILLTLDSFTSNASRQTRVTDANDQVRDAMDRIVSDLRQAATIDAAHPNDLVYTVRESSTSTRQERICLGDDQFLWRTSATTIALTAACADSGSVKITPLTSANSTTNPLFAYDTTSRSVGLTFALNAGNAGRNDISTLRASTFVRAIPDPTIVAGGDDISTTCDATTHKPTLTLSTTVGSTASVKYTDVQGNTLGQGSAGSAITLSSAAASATTVIANVTATSGLVTQLVKTVECAS